MPSMKISSSTRSRSTRSSRARTRRAAPWQAPVSAPEPALASGAPEVGEADAAKTVAEHVVDVPDFPQPGVVFKDLTPLFADGPAFIETIRAIVEHHGADSFDV